MTAEIPEPSIGDVLAAIAGLATQISGVDAKVSQDNEMLASLAYEQSRALAELSSRYDRLRVYLAARLDRVDAGVGQVRADIAGLKAESAVLESSIEGVQETVLRHIEDPNPHRPHAA